MAAFDHTRQLGRADHRTLGLAALGGALEIYDFIIFVFFALTLSQLFFPPQMPEWLRLLQSFGIFVTGYLARPLGDCGERRRLLRCCRPREADQWAWKSPLRAMDGCMSRVGRKKARREPGQNGEIQRL